MKNARFISTAILNLGLVLSAFSQVTYPIVETGVSDFYSNTAIITAPAVGAAFYGQDATYTGNQVSYTDNGDGTITDNVTGLMWQKNMGTKISYANAVTKANNLTLGGHSDWRIPTIKELYSLALFTGRCFGDQAMYKFIDTSYFDQPIGNVSLGEREIDAQVLSSTQYVGLIMTGDTAVFGYNFVDGRLKGYPKYSPMNGTPSLFYFRMVRGNSAYGTNNFTSNGDGTITDSATGLMWQQSDNGTTYDWQNALSYAENLTLAGHSDWRLPNAKELQSIVDYTRSPSTSASPAIATLFSCTAILDPDGNAGQYGYYWSSSPLQDGPAPYSDAVYFCFGKAQGKMETPPNSGQFQLLDVHGAGAQRNDPKTGNAAVFPDYFGPQGDVRYVFNFVRCVRDASNVTAVDESLLDDNLRIYPNPSSSILVVEGLPQDVSSTIEIYSLQGQLVKSIHQLGESIHIDISSLPRGFYIIQIQTYLGSLSRKILIN